MALALARYFDDRKDRDSGSKAWMLPLLAGLEQLLPWLLHHGASVALKTSRPVGHLWRASFGTFSMYAFFYAIGHLHLAVALLLTYSTPLFIPVIGRPPSKNGSPWPKSPITSLWRLTSRFVTMSTTIRPMPRVR